MGDARRLLLVVAPFVFPAAVAGACAGGGRGGRGGDGGAREVAELAPTSDLPVEADSAEASPRPAPPFDWCLPDSPPDEACHAARRDPSSDNVALALAIARKQVDSVAADSLAWNWEEAVLMYGLVELFLVTGEPWLQDYYRVWMDHHIEAGYQIGTSDTCAPAGIAVALFRQTGEAKYEAVGQEALDYLYHQALRTEEGGISHLGTVEIVTLWVDSLFMFGNVLVGWAETTGEAAALDEFGNQLEIFTTLMQDDSGFYVHAHDWIVPQTPDTFWGRGNGWVAAAAAQYLRVRINRGQQDPAAAAAAGRLLAAAAAVQDHETGLWWTILNRPGETYLETSAAALFAFGMARAWRYGLAGDEILEAIALAMEGLRSRIVFEADGRPCVTGVSGPTSADKFEVYAAVPVEDDLPFGIGCAVMALVETSGLPGPED
jgi:unsaturated rhamnogalacturonyl hydrolase